MLLTGSALALGGGKGSRLGFDKKRLEAGGAPVLETIIKKLKSEFQETLLSVKSADEPLPPEIAGLAAPISDTIGDGPLAGIYAALCRAQSEYLFVCACDMPFLNMDFVRFMRALIEKDAEKQSLRDIYIVKNNDKSALKSAGYEPFCAFYSKKLTGAVRQLLENKKYKLLSLIEISTVRIIDAAKSLPFGGETIFFNINTPEDLERAETISKLKFLKSPL